MMFSFNKFSPKLLTLFVFLIVGSFVNGSLVKESSENSERYPSFSTFIEKFQKHYKSMEEFNIRKEIYLSNIELIKKSDCNSCGVNYYADWTPEETLNLRKAKQLEVKQKIGSTGNVGSNHLFSRILSQSSPASFDWRNQTNFTEVKNQGYCGASWAFSTVAFFEQQSIIEGSGNSTVDLSEMYLIGCNPENQGCTAGYIQSSIDLVIDRGGIPIETKYVYSPTSTVATAICVQSDFFLVSNASRMSYYRIHDPETIKQIILKKPVIASVCAADLVFYYPSSGTDSSRILRCKPQNRVVDHSVLLVGYTETEWIVKNHWGKNWGVDGYAYISRNQAEDCCIGEQLHTTGMVTTTCSVDYCQKCVENETCYRCQAGRYVKHNLTTGVQTCEPCTETNCSECYNYVGTCKWCADGYSINMTSGKCVTNTIANCNKYQSTLCYQCKPGYKLNTARSSCNPFCAVKNCNKCSSGICTECKNGFSLMSTLINEKNFQFCRLNNCSVSNCTYCNQTGSCIQCASAYTLQVDGTCATNCTAIPYCVSCTAGSTTCSQCIEGKSWNSTTKVCQVFPITTNCKIHRTACTTCRTGFTLSSGQCIQTCQFTYCTTCTNNDITYCLTCANGYSLNRTDYYSTCTINPCNISGCSLCYANGSCVTCTSKYYVYNATANRCQSQCSIANCKDCLPNATACSLCNTGYSINYSTKLCVESNITHCLTTTTNTNGKTSCSTCQINYFLDSTPTDRCLIWCTDPNCQVCQISSLYICQKCYDGYIMEMVNGIPICKLTPSSMLGCERISYNQSYCFVCNAYYARNQNTGTCELNTKNCPSMCQYCTDPTVEGTQYFGCKCQTGNIYSFDTLQCSPSSLNDTNCITAQDQFGMSFCVQCPMGMLVNAGWDGCQDDCFVPSCTKCVKNYNSECADCDVGYYVGPNSYSCIRCPFEGCIQCNSIKCFLCDIGYELSPNALSCSKIQCKDGFVYDGYECTCPIATYYTPSRCEICSIEGCIECSSSACLNCSAGYFLLDGQCHKCQTNCKSCNSSTSCLQCNDNFVFQQSNCVALISQGSSYYTEGTTVIKCASNCIQCNQSGSCVKCVVGTANIDGTCFDCQGYCKSCKATNLSVCLSCYNGFYFANTDCIPCNDSNCADCSLSASICTLCNAGYHLKNNTCKSCSIQNCQSCNFYGQCSKCDSGYTLTNDFTCEQCWGNCKTCNSSLISQCFVSCNSSSYQANGSCYSCSEKCSTCQSAEVCLSCPSGSLLRNGSCVAACLQGCYQCDSQNSTSCLKCYNGYTLSENYTCEPDLSCNSNASCSICPSQYVLINATCLACNLPDNCLQCSQSNTSECVECKTGYFVNSSLCQPCDQNCLKCSSLNLCSVCKDGYLLLRDQIYGNCTQCNQMCKTCKSLPNICATCKDGFELSINDKCVRIEKIEGQIKLDYSFSSFLTVSKLVRNDLISLLGPDYQSQNYLYIITKLEEGSTILGFYLYIPESLDSEETFHNYSQKITGLNSIGGVPLISINKLDLNDPSKVRNIPTENTKDINKLAIILGVVIPSVVIILAIIGYALRRRIFRANNAVENLPNSTLNQFKEQQKPHKKAKLPPIDFNAANMTPLKSSQLERLNQTGDKTGQIFNEQSYENLYGNNDLTKNELFQEQDLAVNQHKRSELEGIHRENQEISKTQAVSNNRLINENENKQRESSKKIQIGENDDNIDNTKRNLHNPQETQQNHIQNQDC